MNPPDCGDNSCLYAAKRGGMRTNAGCRCDDCPVCGGTVRPRRPVTHYAWCTQQDWVPEHHRSITCPRCGMTSYNLNDVKHGWCAKCNDVTRGERP